MCCLTAVSILRVDSETEFERVGGSCIGGGTYWVSKLTTEQTIGSLLTLSILMSSFLWLYFRVCVDC